MEDRHITAMWNNDRMNFDAKYVDTYDAIYPNRLDIMMTFIVWITCHRLCRMSGVMKLEGDLLR